MSSLKNSGGLSPFGLSGETALITGGGTGLGLAIASAMAIAGASVVLTGRRGDILEEAARQIGERAIPYQLDLNTLDNLKEEVAKISDREYHPGLYCCLGYSCARCFCDDPRGAAFDAQPAPRIHPFHCIDGVTDRNATGSCVRCSKERLPGDGSIIGYRAFSEWPSG